MFSGFVQVLRLDCTYRRASVSNSFGDLILDLGGFDVGMTKQFADGIDVGAACQLQGSERMPEAVE